MNEKYLYSISVEINASPEHVWQVMSDVENWPAWTQSVRRIKRLSKGPFAIGSKVLIYQPKFPPALWRATTLDEGRSFTWVSSGPGIRVTAHHSIEPIAHGCKVTLSVKYDGLFASLLNRLTAKINDKYLGMEAAGLKKQSEKKL